MPITRKTPANCKRIQRRHHGQGSDREMVVVHTRCQHWYPDRDRIRLRRCRRGHLQVRWHIAGNAVRRPPAARDAHIGNRAWRTALPFQARGPQGGSARGNRLERNRGVHLRAAIAWCVTALPVEGITGRRGSGTATRVAAARRSQSADEWINAQLG